MKTQLRLPLYVALVLAGILTAILKRDDQFGLILGLLAIAVGFISIYRWSLHKPDAVAPHNENQDEPAESPIPPENSK